jgi:hypothetical protein
MEGFLMDEKRIELMRQVLTDAYEGIQKITIQATVYNVTAIEENLKRIQLVYNTLGTMAEEQEKDGASNGNVAE